MIEKSYELIVVGGGMSGLCCAIAAARKGIKTALIHNRPVLGGNASSEIRMHICGADHHMSRPNARETGVLEEILLEHKRRNPENTYPIFDSILWEKATFQPNLTLYLNTHMTEVEIEGSQVKGIVAEQITTEKKFRFKGDIFVDATGDGTLGAKSGAKFYSGREEADFFKEPLAPKQRDSFTMGNSLMFKARDMGRPVAFMKPFWANTYTEEQLKYRDHSSITSGYWWIELGGDQYDTITDGEIIRDELLKAVYGIWDHIKNSGNHQADNMELEWVGYLPGKRESRRLVGDYVLTEKDLSEGTMFYDAIAYGGWPMDVHTVGGLLNNSDEPTVFNVVNGIYTIPYRCLYSINVANLMLAGRAISCSHMAFSSTRVMATCAIVGQAVGTAAAIAIKKQIKPCEILSHITELQQQLLKDDCYIPGVSNEDSLDHARNSTVTASGYYGDYIPDNVINGIARTWGSDKNCWKSPITENPWLQLDFSEKKNLKEVRIYLDSNLSREITISINDEVLARQENHSPSELMKDYTLELFVDGIVVFKKDLNSEGQRLQVISFDECIECNQLRVTPLSTYGSDDATIYEIRAYE